MSALEFLTEDDPLEGARAAREFLEEMYAERVISINTPPRKGEAPEDFDKRKEIDKTWCMVRAASRGILNFRTFVVGVMKDAFVNGTASVATNVTGAKTEGGVLQVWYEGTRLEWALTPYQRKMFSLLISKVLPIFTENHLAVTDELASLVITDDAAVKVPHKVRHAVTIISDEERQKGMVSPATARYLHNALNDDSVSSNDMEAEIRRRTGRDPLVLVEGHVEILFDGKRRYILVTEDGPGEAFEASTRRLVDWRMDGRGKYLPEDEDEEDE